jgi:hypothetical protein
MGLFSFIKKIKPFKAISRIVKPVLKNPVKALKSAANQAIKNPARYTTGVLTGGLSEALRATPIVGKAYATSFDQLYAPIFNKAGDVFSGGLYSQTRNIGLTLTARQPMGLNIGNLLGGIGGILNKTNSSGNSYVSALGTGLSLVGSIVPASNRSPAPRSSSAAAAPMLAPIGRAATTLTKEIFTAGNKVLLRLGIRYPVTASGFSSALRRSLGSIASLARRTPAGSIVSILAGLGLTVLEANMLAAWYAQRKKGRRMNPANSRALRRAARRIRSFHKLCTHTDLLKTHHRRPSRSSACR